MYLATLQHCMPAYDFVNNNLSPFSLHNYLCTLCALSIKMPEACSPIGDFNCYYYVTSHSFVRQYIKTPVIWLKGYGGTHTMHFRSLKNFATLPT